jgi:ClpX C4-type zinc finger protein
MVLDERLLAEARAAARAIAELERETAAAATRYFRAVRKLHVAGSSMREIAGALQLSHQRVHQIVDAAGGPPRRWKLRKHPRGPLACSFCERSEDQVPTLIAGANAYICGTCIAAAGQGEFDKVHAASTLRCSFCNKPRRDVPRMIAGPKAQVCEQCLRLCKEISESA